MHPRIARRLNCRCGAALEKSWHLVCPTCWAKVPPVLQGEVYDSYRARQNAPRDEQAIGRHTAAMRSVMQALGPVRRAFTLIELMIVISIIAIIAALVIPAIAPPKPQKKAPGPGQTWLFQGRPAVVLYEIRQGNTRTDAYRVRFVGETGEATALRAELVQVAEASP